MSYFAFTCVVVFMFCALLGGGQSVRLLLGAKFGIVTKPGLNLIERLNFILTAALSLASLVLLYALITYDFSFVYVAGYTDRVLPLFYRITAFWAGQAGSMLFWALSVALMGAGFQLTAGYKALSLTSKIWYFLFYLSILAFFGLILLTWNNPFIVYHAAPLDGNGLNPLLQNPGMIFHPPLLFLGYGGFVIPGCLALAQSLGVDEDEAHWIDVSRPITLLAWLLLSAGIILGAWWAYMELGWGGYWAWDPVENASLIPWLIATAALHTMSVEKRRGKLRRVNVFLMGLTTVSAFFATYLVRSGVVQSVHAFGNGGVGVPLLIFILSSVVLIAWIALKAVDINPEKRELAGLESREGFLVLTSWLLLSLGAIILIATMWPVFTTFWQENILGLGVVPELDAAGHDHGTKGLTADFYNRVCMPLFALLMPLLAVCPWLAWGGGITKKREFFTVIGIFVASAFVLYSFGYRVPVSTLGASGAIAGVCSMLLLLWQSKFKPVGWAIYGVHLGVLAMALGLAFSGPYKVESNPLLSMGQSAKFADYEVTLKNLFEGQGPGFIFVEAELEVKKNGQFIGMASPQRRIYSKWGEMQFAEAATVFSLGSEFYATLMAVDSQARVSLRVSSNPLVNWLWIGGIMLCLFPLFSALRKTKLQTRAAKSKSHATSADKSK